MRIQNCFQQLQQQNKKGLIPYITAGDHSAEATVTLLHTMVAAGADLLEVGVPFSDPAADGPVIEKAHHRAVAKGVSLRDVLTMVARFREKDQRTPIVLMSYLNPIEIMGYETFSIEAEKAGVDGLLAVDCPPEESIELFSVLKAKNIDIIHLISPNTSDERIKTITEVSSGYVYYVSFKGVTGASDRLATDEVQQRVSHIKRFTSLPVCVGFGVKDGETASAISKVADAVIVGTALVKTLETHDSKTAPAIIRAQIREMRSAMDAS